MGPWLIWDEFHTWNPPDFMKSDEFHEIHQISCMKSTRFHGKDFYNVYLYWFWWKKQHSVVYHEIQQISWWNLVDFMVKFGRFHAWNLVDFMVKFGRFHSHGIRWISWLWNPVDFMPRTLVLMKNTAFSGRPYCISVLVLKSKTKIQYSWNLADFMVKSSGFHGEIWQISWNQANFMKSSKFYDEIWQISWWNLADFIHEIRRISWLILKNANFFYNTYNFFFYVNQINNSLAMSSPRLSLWPGAISSS